MLLANILIFVAACLLLLLGLIIIVANPKKSLNQTLAAFQLGAFIWLFTNLITNISTSPELSLYFSRFALIGAVIMMVAIVLFALEFSDIRLTKKRISLLLVMPIILLASVPTEYNIRSIDAGGENLKTGPIYILLIVFVLSYSLIAVYLFWRTYQRSKNDLAKKAQLKYIIIGAILTFVPAVLFSAILPVLGFPNAAFYGPLTIVALSISTTIAIVRHKFLNVRLIAARSAAYFFSVAAIVLIYALTAFTFARSISVLSVTPSQALFFATFSALTALIFQPIKRFFDKFSNAVFYRDAYDGQVLLNELNSSLVRNVNIDSMLNNAASVISDSLKPEFCTFGLIDLETGRQYVVGTKAAKATDQEVDFMVKMASNDVTRTILTDEIVGHREAKSMLNKYGVDLTTKLIVGDITIGYLMLGARKSGSNYSQRDVQLLETAADSVAIAAQNALRFEEIAQFNAELEKKIEDATGKLQKSNEKLKALDEAKDEFISMASHQLRTPLTSVKGYISMILEGDTGPLNDQQRMFLDQAFISSQRMVYLIADLLNVSRIKTGKFVIEPKPTYLPDVIESEISQLYETAKSRGLSLKFNKPKQFATLNLDEVKTRQVIMNFTDNAIYYTPKGGKITLDLKEKAGMVEFTVHDTGIGVPKSEQHHLFTKFYRAGNAKKARPDGTGLGLFMAKKVIVAQGGAILFHTEEGKGSTFGFTFPLAKLEATKNPEPLVTAVR